MKRSSAGSVMLSLSLLLLAALLTAAPTRAADRAALAQSEMQRLYGAAPVPLADTDPEFAAVRDRLVYGQIGQRGVLTKAQRHAVTLVCLAAVGVERNVARAAMGALNDGVDPLVLRESLYQVAPYIGMARAEAALTALNTVLGERKVALPLPPQGTVSEETRFKDGLAVQTGIFGDHISDMHKNAPEGQRDLIVDYLSAWCFGDTYTRRVLDLRDRELVVFAAIVSLGGCDPQARSHAQANINVGNTKQMLVDALSQCLPWIGFPRTLNGLACVNALK